MKNFFLLFALLLISCSKGNYVTFTGFRQGTTYMIVVKNPSEGLQKRIEGVFDEIDNTFSMFEPQSLTSRINRGETDSVTPILEECFVLAEHIHALTEGYFDSTVKPLVDAWGFGPGRQQEIPCVECLLEYVGMDKIRIKDGRMIKTDPRVQLDFSSIAKGFTVDKLAEMLSGEGVTDYLVEVGGEMRAKGVNSAGREWRIQIDKPVPGLVHEREAVISLGSGEVSAVATSGNYRNRFEDESGRTRVHIIDPKTGMPSQGEILSVSIVARSCAAADGWATGIMASGSVENARRLLANADRTPENTSAAGIEYYIIYGTDDGSTASFHSSGFPLSEK